VIVVAWFVSPLYSGTRSSVVTSHRTGVAVTVVLASVEELQSLLLLLLLQSLELFPDVVDWYSITKLFDVLPFTTCPGEYRTSTVTAPKPLAS